MILGDVAALSGYEVRMRFSFFVERFCTFNSNLIIGEKYDVFT
jgi:hypothetical protein